jgi:hypothetical protein
LHKFDGIASLLQPVSDEFEPCLAGNAALYRIASRKKGFGYEFFGEAAGKNDYDWLKTPPATPLFTSLEMEGNAPEFVVQRELPIIHPPTRFAGNNKAATKDGSDERLKSPNTKQKVPLRSITPNQQRPFISLFSSTDQSKSTKPLNHIKTLSSIDHQTKNSITPSVTNQKIITTTDPNVNNKIRTNNTISKSTMTNQHQKDYQFLSSNLSKNMADSKTKQRINKSNVSPVSRPTIPGFSNETPPNLRTSVRSTSATRTSQRITKQAEANINSTAIKMRQSCSPSVTRGRINISESNNNKPDHEIDGMSSQNQKGHLLGSRMVEKLMNARKSSSSVFQERETKLKSAKGLNRCTH